MNEDFEKKLNQLASHDDQLIKWSKQVTEAIENLCHMDIESSELSMIVLLHLILSILITNK